MVDETVTTQRPADPATTHTTVIHENRSSGSGMGIIMALILLVVVIGGIYLFSQNSEVAKDNAVAEAASDVGNAATKVGDAAQDAVSTEK
ncbi:hypothetical protein [Novosphingobium soli]|uniref:Pilus assembly protein n=1 Tax=Novosphingobium soli TaxID=574956 RepID=A0ABV6CYP1_9SPHN